MARISTSHQVMCNKSHLQPSLIVPRPIALITTLGADGVVNAAPFNMMGEDPPIVMVSINRLQDGQLKDTAANIVRSREV